MGRDWAFVCGDFLRLDVKEDAPTAINEEIYQPLLCLKNHQGFTGLKLLSGGEPLKGVFVIGPAEKLAVFGGRVRTMQDHSVPVKENRCKVPKYCTQIHRLKICWRFATSGVKEQQ